MRINEIEERLSAIKSEIENDGADIDALSKETEKLLEERKAIIEKAEKRQQTIKNIVDGTEPVKTVRKFEEENMNTEKRKFTLESAEYRNAWLKNLQGKELDKEERSAISASGVIPTQTLNKIVGKFDLSPILASIDMMYIPGNVSIPVEGTINDASWVSMGTASTDSEDTITSVTLGAYKLIKTVEIGADIQSMSIDAFETWLVDRLYNKIEKAVNHAVINGTGTNEATGILKSGAVTTTGTYTKAGITYSDILTIIGGLKTQYLPNSKFVMPRATFYKEVLNIVDSSKKPIVVRDVQSPALFNILGYPVIIDDNCAADTIIFGDLKSYTFNFAKAPEVVADTSVGFRTGSTVYRAMALADGKVVDKNGLSVYTKATA